MTNNRREYFTESELNKLISAARKGRYGHRDATLILLMARHVCVLKSSSVLFGRPNRLTSA